MASPVSLTRQLGNSTTIDGTTTSVVFGGSNSEFESFANAAVVIPASLTATIQVTNDIPDASGATWTNVATGVTNKPITDPYLITVPARGIKVVRTGGSGVVTCTILQSGGSSTVTISSGNVTATGNVASGATDSGNPLKTGGVYNTTQPTLTNGQRGDTQMDSRANTSVTLGTLVSGEDQTANRLMIEERSTVTSRITSATTTVVKSAAGVLNRIIVEVALTGTATVYDNTAGSGTIVLILPIGTPAGVYAVAIPLATGCTVVTSAADRLVVNVR